MQKLDFNKEGKLVAYTDNGCTDGKSASTEVKGTFVVGADVVNFILAKEYNLPATLRVEMGREYQSGCKWQYFDCFVGNDEQQKLLQEYKHQIDELSNVEKELFNAKEELKRLRKAIYDFNQNARFYERKIKIE